VVGWALSVRLPSVTKLDSRRRAVNFRLSTHTAVAGVEGDDLIEDADRATTRQRDLRDFQALPMAFIDPQ
jgi:hypothetical protein